MKTLIMMVAVMVMGAATSFAAAPKASPNDDKVINSLVVTIEKDVAPCTDLDDKKSDSCKAVTAIMDKHIMTAAKQDQDKYWDLLEKTDRVFHYRAEATMRDLKDAPRAKTAKDQKEKMKKTRLLVYSEDGVR